MSSPEHTSGRYSRRDALRAGLGLALAGLVAGCGFRPLYGDQSVAGSASARDRLASIDVAPIEGAIGSPEGRLSVEVRNALLYELQGGGGGQSPAYKLQVRMIGQLAEVVPNTQTGRREVEIYGIDAVYSLSEVGTGKKVLDGTATSRVTFNSPGEQQRFARSRGLRDAENRAAQVLAEQIKLRLASHFASGG
jgi:LPS-assembly lipoprotein